MCWWCFRDACVMFWECFRDVLHMFPLYFEFSLASRVDIRWYFHHLFFFQSDFKNILSFNICWGSPFLLWPWPCLSSLLDFLFFYPPVKTAVAFLFKDPSDNSYLNNIQKQRFSETIDKYMITKFQIEHRYPKQLT